MHSFTCGWRVDCPLGRVISQVNESDKTLTMTEIYDLMTGDKLHELILLGDAFSNRFEWMIEEITNLFIDCTPNHGDTPFEIRQCLNEIPA